jgi:hypothetical protein
MSPLHKKTRQRAHLEVVPDDPAPCCRAEWKRDLAVMAFEEGLRAFAVGLPTDGWDVARKMALLLVGDEDDDGKRRA